MFQTLDRIIDLMAGIIISPGSISPPPSPVPTKHDHLPPIRPKPPLPPRPGPGGIPAPPSSTTNIHFDFNTPSSTSWKGHHFLYPGPRPTRTIRLKTVHWGPNTEIPYSLIHIPAPTTNTTYSSNTTPSSTPKQPKPRYGHAYAYTYEYRYGYGYGHTHHRSILKPPTALDNQMFHINTRTMAVMLEQRLDLAYDFLDGLPLVGDAVLDEVLCAEEELLAEEAAAQAKDLVFARPRLRPRSRRAVMQTHTQTETQTRTETERPSSRLGVYSEGESGWSLVEAETETESSTA